MWSCPRVDHRTSTGTPSDGSRRGIFGRRHPAQRCKAEAKGQKRREKLLESKKSGRAFQGIADDLAHILKLLTP